MGPEGSGSLLWSQVPVSGLCSEPYPVHIFTLYLLKIHLKIILLSVRVRWDKLKNFKEVHYP
jgi:hypothetical protein